MHACMHTIATVLEQYGRAARSPSYCHDAPFLVSWCEVEFYVRTYIDCVCTHEEN
jgi:hypothetical protein